MWFEPISHPTKTPNAYLTLRISSLCNPQQRWPFVGIILGQALPKGPKWPFGYFRIIFYYHSNKVKSKKPFPYSFSQWYDVNV